MSYEIICGIETHIELSTKSKIFCSCPVSFGEKPNTNVCPICTGLPGSMPHFNEKILDFSIMAGLATNCKINDELCFDRKNYFYPDLPKGYQITQHEKPLCKNGYIELSSGKKIRINRIHMEEDAAKLIHKDGKTFIDHNRSGIPLIEVVSEPDISSSDEALEYVKKLQQLIEYLGISNCKMQEGSLRCDINISVRKIGTTHLNTKTEIKNVNSLSFIKKAIEIETLRQINILENGGEIVAETRRYNEFTNETESMRKKEAVSDYRYFKEPDLPTVKISKDKINYLKNLLPENPNLKFKRFINEFNLPEPLAHLLSKYRKVAEYFEAACENIKNKTLVANFITTEIFKLFSSEPQKQQFNISVSALDFNQLMILLDENKISQDLAKLVFTKMLKTKKSFESVISEINLEPLDLESIKKLCLETIKENQKAFKDFKLGKEKAIDVLLSYVVKNSNGRADLTFAKDFISNINLD